MRPRGRGSGGGPRLNPSPMCPTGGIGVRLSRFKRPQYMATSATRLVLAGGHGGPATGWVVRRMSEAGVDSDREGGKVRRAVL